MALVEQYLQFPTKTELLLHPYLNEFSGINRAACQRLFLGTVRNKLLLETILNPLIRQETSLPLRAHLLVALFECMDSSDRVPQIVHDAVERIRGKSSYEGKFVNAVLRRAVERLAIFLSQEPNTVESLATYYSHPQWLVERWISQIGWDNTRQLLKWDQVPPDVYVRARQSIEGVEPTEWTHFYKCKAANWPQVQGALDQHHAYVQDPSTRLAVDALAPEPGQKILELCAAPGGKSVQIAECLFDDGNEDSLLVCMDRPNGRLQALKDNLLRYDAVKIVSVDLMRGDRAVFDTLRSQHLCRSYDAVLLDAPCSNTGVLRRRPDAKWRLQPEDFGKLRKIQSRMLGLATQCVRPGGRLVYSTCSVDNEESVPEFDRALLTLESSRVYFPYDCRHDGVSVAIFRKK